MKKPLEFLFSATDQTAVRVGLFNTQKFSAFRPYKSAMLYLRSQLQNH